MARLSAAHRKQWPLPALLQQNKGFARARNPDFAIMPHSNMQGAPVVRTRVRALPIARKDA